MMIWCLGIAKEINIIINIQLNSNNYGKNLKVLQQEKKNFITAIRGLMTASAKVSNKKEHSFINNPVRQVSKTLWKINT